MKFVTYVENGNDAQRFGFVMDGHVVDVLRASIFMNEQNHESEFLEIPSALHACLEEWEPNLVKLQRLQDQSMHYSELTNQSRKLIPIL